MQIARSVLANALSRWIGNALHAVIGFLLVPFLITALGESRYGLISIVGVIISVTGLADMGLRAGLARNLAEQVARRDTQRFNELISTGLVIYLVAAAACVFAVAGLAPLLAVGFKIPREHMAEGVVLIRYYAAFVTLTSFIAPVYGATLTSNNRFDIANYIDTAFYLAESVAFFVVLSLTPFGLYGWMVVSATGRLLRLVVSAYAACRVWPTLRIRPRFCRPNALGTLFSLGWKMFVFQVTDLLSVRSDPLVITSFFGPRGVALYNPAQTLPGLGRQIVDTLRSQLHPLATGMFVKGQKEGLRRILFDGTRYTLLMGIPVCVVLSVFAFPIVNFWLGGTPIANGCRTTAWIMIGWAAVDLLNYTAGSQWAVLLGMNRLNFLVWTQVAAGVLNILLSIYLVGFTRLGIVGVIVPTVLIAAVRRPLTSLYAAHACGTTFAAYIRHAYVRPLVVAVIQAATALALLALIRPAALLPLLVCIGAVAVTWVPLCWYIGFDDADRRRFGALASAFLARGAVLLRGA